MRGKILWLLKVIGLSICLFVIWRPAGHVYGFILDLLDQFHPLHQLLRRNEATTYLQSLLLIPFISLTILTPGITILKKAATIAILTSALLLLEFTAIMFMMDSISANASALMAYRSVQIAVPLLIWIIMCFPYVSKQYAAAAIERRYVCPLCKGEYSEILGHIQGIHGEKSLGSKKVKRLISDNPEISA